MKVAVLIAAVIALVALGFYLVPREEPEPVVQASLERPRPNTVVSDPTVVFQRAFWKHPLADDRIHHAERREWSDENGVKRWQWFISVDPSAELVKHLREDNAFGLVPMKSSAEVRDAPPWFTFESEDIEVIGAQGGNMRLSFSNSGRLFATDSGGGFQAGASESPSVPPQAAGNGRLPYSPPPRPNP